MNKISWLLMILGFIGFMLSMRIYDKIASFYSGATLVLFIIIMLLGFLIGEGHEEIEEEI